METPTLPADAFYLADGDTYVSTGCTPGPWGSSAQHGGPPAALLARAIERLPSANGADLTVSRIAVDLLGPVPVAPLLTRTGVLRPGRSVELVQAELVDPAAGRTVARATAWRVPVADTGVDTVTAAVLPPPSTGAHQDRPAQWSGGYLDAVEWAWLEGSVTSLGPATVWMRPRVPLVAGETTTPLQRLMLCVDSASGVSATLDLRHWRFLNTDLTVHMLREPRGEWIGLRARTDVAGTAAGVAVAEAHDRDGLVARSAQALLVAPA